MKSNKTFKIGELSKFFNIGVDSIRYYEKVGILNSFRDPQNNYRCYTIEDFRRIVLIREMLDLGFSTQQIREFVIDRSVSKTESMLSAEINTIDDQIRHLKYRQKHIKNRLNSINTILSRYDNEQIQELSLDNRYCIMVRETNIPDNLVDYYLIKYMNQSESYIGTVGFCDCYTLDLPGSNPDSDYYRTKNVFFYSESFPKNKCNYILPEGLYLSVIYKGPLKKTKKILPAMYDHAQKHGLVPNSDPIEFCYIDEYETSNEEEYLIEIQLPVTRAK